MKNLKRVLSLVLATVMVIGMMVVGASAASYNDFTDKAEIDHAEAVALLNDLKIIEGYNGVYAPDATIDRAGMAKLITKIMMGDVDPAVFAGTETDLTDIDGHWAEGYIKYCYANGIIAGYAGKFAPNEPIDVVGAAKLLLVALGYDAENRGYVNNGNWSVNIMRDAATTRDAQSLNTRSLTAGLTCKATDPLTRDAAAQMIFNALFVNTYAPTYQWDMGTQHINGYTYTASMANTMYGNPVRISALVSDVTSGKAVLTAGSYVSANEAVASAAAAKVKYEAAPMDGSSDMLGNTVVFYMQGGEIMSSALTVASSTVLATSVNGTKVTGYDGSSVKADLTTKNSANKGFKAQLDSAVYFLNGGTSSESAVNTAAAKIGTIVELIDTDGDGKAEVVKATEKTVDFVTGDTAIKTVADGDDMVKIPGVIASFTSSNTVKTVVGYEGLTDGDVVLKYTDAANGITYIEKCDSFTGTVTAKKDGKWLINGTYYTLAGLEGKDNAANVAGKSVTVWVDSNNYIVKIEADSVAASDYGVIVKTAWVSNQGVDAAASSLEAKLLKADGTTETVIVTKLGTDKIVRFGEGSGTEGAAGANEVVKANGELDNNIYKYTLEDGKVELTALTGGDYDAYDNGTIKKGVPMVDATEDSATNNNTVYVYATKNGNNVVYTVYTGFQNAPTTTNTKTIVALKNGVAEFVYVDATVASATAGDAKDGNYLYVLDTTVTERFVDGKTYYDITASLNGETEDLTVTTKSSSVKDILAGSATLYEVTLDDDGYVTAATKQVASGTDFLRRAVKTSAANGVLVTVLSGNDYTYSYNDESVVYVVDGDVISVGSMEDAQKNDSYTDVVLIKTVATGTSTADDTTIDTIYIVKTEI